MRVDGRVRLIVLIGPRRFFGCRSERLEFWGAGLGGGDC